MGHGLGVLGMKEGWLLLQATLWKRSQENDGYSGEQWKELDMAMGGLKRDSYPALGVRIESWRFPEEAHLK